MNNTNIKNIYLAGSSRGGCLAMRLSKRFRANYSSDNLKVIVVVLMEFVKQVKMN